MHYTVILGSLRKDGLLPPAKQDGTVRAPS